MTALAAIAKPSTPPTIAWAIARWTFWARSGSRGSNGYYPVGYRPEPGDRAVVRGMWIVDCGHPDWHGELHPASMLQSSYLQTNDYVPVLGATWDRPLRLTSKWRAITNGEPAVVTKIVVSPIFAEDRLDMDVWPPARPCVGARLHVEREDLKPNPRWRGVHLTETLLPTDGNPNHLHLTVTRAAPYQLDFGGDGDVTNPDSKLTFFTAYMAWWTHDFGVVPGARLRLKRPGFDVRCGPNTDLRSKRNEKRPPV